MSENITFAPASDIRNGEWSPVLNPFLARRRNGWWESVGREALVDDALVYVELESEAARVRTFKIDLVDGLMQTPEYTSAVVRASKPRSSEQVVPPRVDVRTQRQARLYGPDPIKVEAILTECVLRIQVGGRDVMRRQLEHLLDLMELPNVDLRVVPANTAYPAMGTPFYILTFKRRYPDIGYVELLDKGVYLEEPDDVEQYAVRFAGLRAVALDPDDTRELIAEIASDQN